ncbi:MAG TPA: hypothetical protein VFC41_06915 [Anaerovoracaceae bacterium]|nr:hypothetical protein [Anaerovoracaceae bacterium]
MPGFLLVESRLFWTVISNHIQINAPVYVQSEFQNKIRLIEAHGNIGI